MQRGSVNIAIRADHLQIITGRSSHKYGNTRGDESAWMREAASDGDAPKRSYPDTGIDASSRQSQGNGIVGRIADVPETSSTSEASYVAQSEAQSPEAEYDDQYDQYDGQYGDQNPFQAEPGPQVHSPTLDRTQMWEEKDGHHSGRHAGHPPNRRYSQIPYPLQDQRQPYRHHGAACEVPNEHRDAYGNYRSPFSGQPAMTNFHGNFVRGGTYTSPLTQPLRIRDDPRSIIEMDDSMLGIDRQLASLGLSDDIRCDQRPSRGRFHRRTPLGLSSGDDVYPAPQTLHREPEPTGLYSGDTPIPVKSDDGTDSDTIQCDDSISCVGRHRREPRVRSAHRKSSSKSKPKPHNKVPDRTSGPTARPRSRQRRVHRPAPAEECNLPRAPTPPPFEDPESAAAERTYYGQQAHLASHHY
ncbi:hypothetical protein SPBR_00702 [Sporothrix brasiliensis 5110]|uniref:Uncharacterized protein n=1 Tax=Sporothrix brasiliensis 5110 TaxID=1398154 RepID=A0A0C2J0W8_9PEZI|nr:uncharacterized protein SPBR_00702 [Sporothrix brasiliensis 5110]KIH90807.1 hypothetical protein SPBR_00702 [Sporothrix brasiliensis 5110]